MSTMWERYTLLLPRQRVLFGVMFMFIGGVGVYMEAHFDSVPSFGILDKNKPAPANSLAAADVDARPAPPS